MRCKAATHLNLELTLLSSFPTHFYRLLLVFDVSRYANTENSFYFLIDNYDVILIINDVIMKCVHAKWIHALSPIVAVLTYMCCTRVKMHSLSNKKQTLFVLGTINKTLIMHQCYRNLSYTQLKIAQDVQHWLNNALTARLSWLNNVVLTISSTCCSAYDEAATTVVHGSWNKRKQYWQNKLVRYYNHCC